MKRASILSLCALVCAGAFAQPQVLKDAEKAMKDKKSFADVVAIVTPAQNNPATANSVDAYYIPGVAGFNTFDDIFAKESLGMMTEPQRKERADALVGAYEMFMKALPLDSLPDEKGKVKPKRSKDMINKIGGHYSDYDRVAVDYWTLEDFDNAYKAWDIYCTLPYDPRFQKAIAPLPHDSIVANAMFNRSLAAFNTGDMRKALNSFLDTKAKGYNKKAVYDLAISAAYQLDDQDALIALCDEALPLYGAEDSRYISVIINKYIDAKDYKQAADMINQAIANDPTNVQYYIIRGILYEQDGVEGDSKAEFAKAVELDSKNSDALYNYGRTIYNEAIIANDNAPTDPEEYNKVFRSTVLPTLKEAIEYLEQAWEANADNRDALKLLEQAYYLANDQSNLKYTQDRLAE